MFFKKFNKFLSSKKFGYFAYIICFFSFGSIFLKSLGMIISGQGMDDVITAWGIRTNSIVTIVSFSITLIVAILLFISIRKEKDSNKNRLYKKKKHNNSVR